MGIKSQISLSSNILVNLCHITLVDNGKESKNVSQGFKTFCNDIMEIKVVGWSDVIRLGKKTIMYRVIYKIIDTTYEVNRSYSEFLNLYNDVNLFSNQ